ncbi:MAG TPA: APC family permease [Geminicoccaceae bacterium]|nr:APC family permease [Geminicoccaceae bacterium]
MAILDVVLGRRLANRESGERKIGAFEGVPAMGLDGLGSSAYGPEAALTVLIPLGVASLAYIGWVMAPILALLAILCASYWQTIRAYPNNGGAYIVSKENLGTNASLLAAAALMIDYVLTVAVGISAGVAALVSAVPALHPYILPLCLGILLLVTVANLRGTLDAGRLFAAPTYLFVASFAAIMAIGLYKALESGGSPQPVVPPPALGHATEAASVWLLLRAFASGCTAMTGVEAVSNGMSAFRDPPVKYGHRTLAAIVVILGMLLAGIAYLATAFGIGAMDQTKEGYRSVLSQLASAVVGDGIFYYVAIGSLLCVLALSANTSFVGFPRLCRMIAQDGFLPKPFAVVGRRLVFSVGILYLALWAGLLLTVFGGITDHLIPLFAIGAFMTFTLSQAGMVAHCFASCDRTNPHPTGEPTRFTSGSMPWERRRRRLRSW